MLSLSTVTWLSSSLSRTSVKAQSGSLSSLFPPASWNRCCSSPVLEQEAPRPVGQPASHELAARAGQAEPALRHRFSLAERAEGGPHLADECLGLLQGGEVAPLVQLVPVAQVREDRFRLPARGPVELAGEDGAAGRDGHGVHGELSGGFPVDPGC
jgi:hypothetical protein